MNLFGKREQPYAKYLDPIETTTDLEKELLEVVRELVDKLQQHTVSDKEFLAERRRKYHELVFKYQQQSAIDPAKYGDPYLQTR